MLYTEEQIRKAGESGEISKIDIEHLISILEKHNNSNYINELITNIEIVINSNIFDLGDNLSKLDSALHIFYIKNKKIQEEKSDENTDIDDLPF